jgi:hypothetical protein
MRIPCIEKSKWPSCAEIENDNPEEFRGALELAEYEGKREVFPQRDSKVNSGHVSPAKCVMFVVTGSNPAYPYCLYCFNNARFWVSCPWDGIV